MNRRQLTAGLLAASAPTLLAPATLLWPPPARAQSPASAAAARGRFSEGVHFIKLAQAAPTAAPGKIEVIEFFWYECPHCDAFEPTLEAWSKQAPPDVALRRVPVYFAEVPFAAQQRLFYALEATGQLENLHRKVFHTIHVDRRRMRTPEDFSAFLVQNGTDPLPFIAAYSSPAVQARAEQARRTAAAYKIDGVPAMGMNGRYYTTAPLAMTGMPPSPTAAANARMLDVVDALLPTLRRR